MRYILSLLMLCVMMTVNAQRLKVSYKGEINPYKFKIEKIVVKNGQTTVFAEVKQQQNFSYSILFDDCALIPNTTGTPVKGTLASWDESDKVTDFAKPVSDQKTQKFTIVFPGEEILSATSFDIKMGTVQNRKKTPIVFNDIKIKK